MLNTNDWSLLELKTSSVYMGREFGFATGLGELIVALSAGGVRLLEKCCASACPMRDANNLVACSSCDFNYSIKAKTITFKRWDNISPSLIEKWVRTYENLPLLDEILTVSALSEDFRLWVEHESLIEAESIKF